jgi:methylaspartate ammonia-lyase
VGVAAEGAEEKADSKNQMVTHESTAAIAMPLARSTDERTEYMEKNTSSHSYLTIAVRRGICKALLRSRALGAGRVKGRIVHF